MPKDSDPPTSSNSTKKEFPKPITVKMEHEKLFNAMLESMTKSQNSMAEILGQTTATTAALEKNQVAMQQVLQKIAEKVFGDDSHPTRTINIEFVMESISNSISSEFVYDPDNNFTFESWYSKYSDLFNEDAKRLDDKQKVRVLLRKLGTREHELFKEHISPKSPSDLSFDETIKKLNFRFGSKETIFRSRFKCLRVSKKDGEDYFTYAGRINKLMEKVDYKKMSEDQFKCLLYVVGLQSNSEAKLREKLLNRLETQLFTSDDGTSASTSAAASALQTLDQLAYESERFASMKEDSQIVEGLKSVNKVHAPTSSSRENSPEIIDKKISNSKENQNDVPSRLCWKCGELHYVKDCPFQDKTCPKCKEKGHKDGYCSKQSKQKAKFSHAIFTMDNVNVHRRYVNVFINNSSVFLQLDTASDVTVISEDVWRKIGSPKLSLSLDKIESASTNRLEVIGKFSSSVVCNSQSHRTIIFVTSNHKLNIFGSQLMTEFGFWDIPFNKFSTQLNDNDSPEKVISSNNETEPKQSTTKLATTKELDLTATVIPISARILPCDSTEKVIEQPNNLHKI